MAAGNPKATTAPELRKERGASKLNLPELTKFIHGGEWMSAKRKAMAKLVCEDPVLNLDDGYFLNSEEEYEKAIEKSIHLVKKNKELNLDDMDDNLLGSFVGVRSFGIHKVAFIPTLQGQATDQQKEKWLTRARNFEIIGAYAQTELGHGTFVRGLETTATYDPGVQEFVLNTPTLTATKWWPGGLGHTSTHAIIMARLITKGTDHGIHFFIVQLRSLEDHTPLPGIIVGDIGSKFGFNDVDHGFLRLNNVRIPRDQMLMKYSQVLPDGTYVQPPSTKMSYGTMVLIRAQICTDVGWALAKSTTIATRYSVVRRQGQPDEGKPEAQVLDYQTQQLKLLPLIATAYAVIQTGHFMLHHYTQGRSEIARGNLEVMPELHATTAGLKAFSTDIVVQGVELCRMACGGHGYSCASGIPDIYAEYSSACTFEGENTVLYLQTARYLNKMLSRQLPSSDLPENVAYLSKDFKLRPRCPLRTAFQYEDPHIQLEVYRQRARRMVEVASKAYQRALNCGSKQSDAWNESSCDWVAAAKAHCHYVTLKAFRESLHNASLSGPNLRAMEALCTMFAVFGILNHAGEFMMAGHEDRGKDFKKQPDFPFHPLRSSGYMTHEQVSLARDKLYQLLEEVRREAVPLVDAFDLPDVVLNSALGRYDGDVYTHLYQWAQHAPRNKSKVHNAYHKHLRKLLKSKL